MSASDGSDQAGPPDNVLSRTGLLLPAHVVERVSDDFPGWLALEVTDADGRVHRIVEKDPVLGVDSRPGDLPTTVDLSCTEIVSADGRTTVRLSHGVETTEAEQHLTVSREALLRPPVSPVELVGWWHDNVLFSPGAMTDWYCVFRGDGWGFLAYSIWLSMSVDTFRWSVDAGVLSIAPGRCFDCDMEGNLESEPVASDLQLSSQVVITLEDTPVEGIIEVLRFPSEAPALMAAGFAFSRIAPRPLGSVDVWSLPVWGPG